jgi:hypothetical protein
VANSKTDTNPVWSSTDPDAGPCLACGGNYATLEASERLEYTHCGGTGAICINKATGQTCSCGTAPDLGNFPGGIKDFIFWGDGAYGLSIDGNAVYALGTATSPVWDIGAAIGTGWTNLYAIGPDRIAISGKDGTNTYKVARSYVNSIAEHTCCD